MRFPRTKKRHILWATGAAACLIAGGGVSWVQGASFKPHAATETLLQAGHGCGTHWRCEFQFAGKELSSGKPIYGTAWVLDVTENGALLENLGEHYVVNRGWGQRPGSRTISIQEGQLDIGKPIPIRELNLDLKGKNFRTVTGKLWRIMMDAPIRDSSDPRYQYSPDDARMTGVITLEGKVTVDLPPNRGILLRGKRLILDKVPVRILHKLQLTNLINDSQVKITFPVALPEPKFEGDFFDSDKF